MKNPEIPIAREGLPFILFCAFATLISAVFGYSVAAFLGLTATFFVTWFFRDPFRILPVDKDAIICPADGKVIAVKQMFDERFLQQDVVRVSIFMNVFNVHVNRVPFSGIVERVLFKPGEFYSADKHQAALHNEYCAMTVSTASGQQYVAVQIAGLIARRIICWAEPGDRVEGGQRYGLIRFGSRVDLYLPEGTELTVHEGQKVRAGETVLGKMKSETERT
ncbi:MAG: phosphatidylserine decarboxylase family protein [Candidatus Electrothrix sp. ATG2]|nr:phosphatidylserine decarboxylase family protein [Candidatus Electrothrix sp. ATG2]